LIACRQKPTKQMLTLKRDDGRSKLLGEPVKFFRFLKLPELVAPLICKASRQNDEFLTLYVT
jgi:hypothetical protein